MLPLNRYSNHTSNTKYFLVGCITLLIKSTLNMTLNCVTLTSIASGWCAYKVHFISDLQFMLCIEAQSKIIAHGLNVMASMQQPQCFGLPKPKTK